jgi:hypothetical protein
MLGKQCLNFVSSKNGEDVMEKMKKIISLSARCDSTWRPSNEAKQQGEHKIPSLEQQTDWKNKKNPPHKEIRARKLSWNLAS